MNRPSSNHRQPGGHNYNHNHVHNHDGHVNDHRSVVATANLANVFGGYVFLQLCYHYRFVVNASSATYTHDYYLTT